MSRILMTLAGLTILLCGAFCSAQEPPTAQTATTRPAGDKRNVRNFRPEDPNFLLDRMIKELNLDEAQQQAVSKALKDHLAYMTQIRQSMQQQPSEGYEKMRAITDEMRTARETGDNEKVKQLSEQLRQIGQEQQARMAPMRQQIAESQDKLRGELMATLHDDQKSAFEKFWDERMARQSPYRGPERSPQALKSLVDRLPALSAEQRQQIDQLFRQHVEAAKATQKGTPAERTLVTKLYDSVMALLTPEQRSLLESQLAGRRSGVRDVEVAPPPAGRPVSPAPPAQPVPPQDAP